MEQRYRNNGLINWIALLLTTVASVFVAQFAETAAGLVGTAFLGLGFMVAAVSYVQMRLAERERLERMEFEELKRAKGDSTLFAEAASDTFPAQRAREQFDRFFVPGFTIVLVGLAGFFAYWGWGQADRLDEPAIDKATLSMALYGLFGLVLFLLGKYSVGLARLESEALLRPGGSHMMLGAIISFLVVAAEAAAIFEAPRFDFYAAKTLSIFLGVVAVEMGLALIFEIYRPKGRGRASRMIYESRLIALLGQPQGIISTVAQALDYQFGFKVSETWFYRFLEKALAWLVLIQLSLLTVSSMVVIIGPHERAVKERLGKPSGSGELGPGLHLKLPWPLDKIYRFPTKEIQSFNVGFTPHEEGDAAHDEFGKRVLLWTKSHYLEEENMLVASRDLGELSVASGGAQAVPVNLLTVSVPIHFIVNDLKKWTYHAKDPAGLLHKIAHREVVRYLMNVDFNEIMSTGRGEAAEHLKAAINKRAEEFGVEITFVGLQDIHPPVKVADAFEKVISAERKREAKTFEARGYALKTLATAKAEAAEVRHRARAQAAGIVAEASAFAASLTNRAAAYEASPSVFKERLFYEDLGAAVADARKYYIGTDAADDEVIILNLEDELRSDLLNISVPE